MYATADSLGRSPQQVRLPGVRGVLQDVAALDQESYNRAGVR